MWVTELNPLLLEIRVPTMHPEREEQTPHLRGKKGEADPSFEKRAAPGGGGHGDRRSLQSLSGVEAVSSTIHTGSPPGLWDWQGIRKCSKGACPLFPRENKELKEGRSYSFLLGRCECPWCNWMLKGSSMPSFQVSIQLAGLLMHPLTSRVVSFPGEGAGWNKTL